MRKVRNQQLPERWIGCEWPKYWLAGSLSLVFNSFIKVKPCTLFSRIAMRTKVGYQVGKSTGNRKAGISEIQVETP